MSEINRHSREDVNDVAVEASKRLAGVELTLTPEEHTRWVEESEKARNLAELNNDAARGHYPGSERYDDYHVQQAQNRVNQRFGLAA